MRTIKLLYLMSAEESLKFLESNQPMSGDNDITQEQCDFFVSALKHFLHNPDERCIPLVINCVSADTGMGMYETISDVLLKQSREQVVDSIRDALKSGTDAIRYRCCWWAIDIDAWDLEEFIWPLRKSSNEDLSEAAKYYLKLKHEKV